MPKRRDYKTGSLYQRADGLWVGTIEAGFTKSGARRRITVSSKDKTAAKKKLRDKRLQLEREGAPAGGSARTTVKSYAEEWIEQRKTAVRPKPWATDASAIRQWIVPTIGHKRLEELTPKDIRAVRTAQTKAGRSSSTARRTHTTLTAMLRAAMLDGHAVPARCLLVDAPGVAVNDRTEMPVAELLLMLNAAHELLPHWSRWFAQALYGMRPAEVLGTTRDALDLDAGLLVVEWQLQPLPYLDRANKPLGFQVPDGYEARHLVDSYHLTRPKTKRGQRVLPLVPAMRTALTGWLEQAPENPWGLVWPAASGRPANEKHDLAEWYALQDTVGVRHPSGRHYYIYEARHGLATRLMEEGVDEHVITALMGHSSIVTSRGYMHANQRHALEAMEKVAARLQLNPGRTAS
jgi:integrase